MIQRLLTLVVDIVVHVHLEDFVRPGATKALGRHITWHLVRPEEEEGPLMESKRLPIWATLAIGLTVFALATAAAIWLGGFSSAFSKVMPFGKVDFTTWWAYWTHYGSDAAVAKRLNVSMICAAVVSYGAPIAIGDRCEQGDTGAARSSTVCHWVRGPKGRVFWAPRGSSSASTRADFAVRRTAVRLILMAPTRSGKGVSTVIPNLLSWNESVVVLDVKLENYDIYRLRAKFGQEVYLFNPFSESFRTARYNPLGYVRDGDFRVADLTAIGEVTLSVGRRTRSSTTRARNLFVGLGLFCAKHRTCRTHDR